MKIVVLGDLHLGGGYSLGKIDPYRQLNTRLIDHSNTMDHVIDFMVDQGVEHLVLTGDIYEHRRPEASQMAIFSEKLSRLSDLGIHTHIVTGNHDIVRAHKATTMDKFRLLKLPKIHVYNDIETFNCVDHDGTEVNLLFMPFRTKQMLQCCTNEEALVFLKERLAAEKKTFNESSISFIIGHLTLQGARQQTSSLEDHAIFDIILPPDLFEGFDGVFMGHVHQFQVISESPLIVHTGSMERTDFGEASQRKTFVLLEAKEKAFTYEFLPLPVKFLYDIIIDKSDDSSEKLVENIKNHLRSFNIKNNLNNSIVRVTITIGEHSSNIIDTSDIMKFLVRDLKVSNCVGVHVSIVSKRQLRDSTITEKVEPHAALKRWLELNITNTSLREEMIKAGSKIIDEGNIS